MALVEFGKLVDAFEALGFASASELRGARELLEQFVSMLSKLVRIAD